MALRFLGAVTITPGTPKKLSVVFPNERGKSVNSLIVAQRRVNVGFVFVGDFVMAGESTASWTIAPASASQCPFTTIALTAGQDTIDSFSLDGTAAEVVQVSVMVT